MVLQPGIQVYKQMLAQCDAVMANTWFEPEFAGGRGRGSEAAGVGIQPGLVQRRNGRKVCEIGTGREASQ